MPNGSPGAASRNPSQGGHPHASHPSPPRLSVVAVSRLHRRRRRSPTPPLHRRRHRARRPRRTRATHATLCLLNAERRAPGLRPLRLDTKLTAPPSGHARDMVAQHYFDHDSWSGAAFDERIKRTGWTKSRRSYTMGENIGWGGGRLVAPRSMVRGWMNTCGHKANILARAVPLYRHRHRRRRPHRRVRRDLHHRLRRLSLSTGPWTVAPFRIRGVARGEAVRRRQAGVLVVGAAEPEIQSWLRAAGHLPRAVRRRSAAGRRWRRSRSTWSSSTATRRGWTRPRCAARCATTRGSADAWMLAITVAAKGRMADAALDAGADDYLHRPFTRAELIARARAGPARGAASAPTTACCGR